MRDQCYEFMVTLVTELQDRLPSQMKILQEMSVLSPRWCLSKPGVPKCLPELTEVLHFPQDLMVKVEFQWEKLKSMDWKEKKHTGKFWAEVKAYEDAVGERPFTTLADFAMLLLVLPWSNADVERAFSIMKIVKDPRRNRMSNTVLNAIQTIRAGLRRLGKCCHDYEYPKAVSQEMGTNAKYGDAQNTAARSPTVLF
ncbi:Porphobilinogen deaminase [Frankliniella fusca]|uniref:Porphobilinogen deaminase n=1 Tax=Frankliniella fusca TaxID=407009 RepID=A0AAE1HWX0_9NEOP|nr:Porphobilinogen deaminase [Frankliniella fusca]